MKKLSLITKICIIIFLFLFSMAILLSVPMYKRLSKIVDKYSELLVTQVADKTGLIVSYESISPSVLAYLGVKGINVNDKNGRTIVSVKNTHIKYKILPLLKKNYNSILKGIAINGVDLNVVELIDFIKEFNSYHAPPDSPDTGQKKMTEEQVYDQIKMIMEYIPPNITVKNLNVLYDKNPLNASLLVKEIRVLNPEQKKSIDFNIKTDAHVIYADKVDASGDISFNGSITDRLENSYININLANFTQGKFKLNKLNFLASYNQRKLSFRTVQNVIPVALDFIYDIDESQAEVKVQTQDLSPVSVFSSVSDKNLLNKIKDITLTVNANAAYGIKNKIVTYSSNGKVFVPPAMIPGSMTVNYSLAGNDKKVILNTFDVDGENYKGNADLAYVFETMQLSGIAELQKLVLPNQKTVSTEIYFDPLEKSGFMIFSPQIFIGDKALTALQSRIMPRDDSIDFDLEVSDYSHIGDADSMSQGTIKLDGSYLTNSKYFQTNLSLNTIYLDTVLGLVKEVVNQKDAGSIQSVQNSVADFVFSGDAYISTDLKSVSYNVPYLVLANTRKENQVLMLVVNGNEQSIQVNNFYLVYGSLAIDATASLDSMPGSSDKFYTVDLLSSSIPYHFSGSIMPEVITLTGDYGTDAEVRIGKNRALDGFATFKGLPFMLQNSAYIVSLDTTFGYNEEEGPNLTLQHLQVEKDSPDSSVNPRLEISGSGTKYGAQINSISYTDLYSSLNGNSDITINIDNNIFSSAGIQMNLHDELTDESFVIDASVSNPDAVVLNKESIFTSLYANAMVEISNFSLNRFMNVKHDNNEITASVYLSGTLEHPYATASVQKLTFLLNDEIVSAGGSAILEERDLTINDFFLNAKRWKVDEVSGNASLNDFTGKVSARFTTAGEKNIQMPLILEIQDSYIPEDSVIPESLTAKLECPSLSGTLFKKPVAFDLSVNYTKDFLSFYSSENTGLYGTFGKDEGLYASWKMGDILSTEITGSLDKSNPFIKLSNINVNLNKLFENITIDDILKVEQGLLKGSVTMRGPFNTPDFKGALSIANPSFSLPSVFEQKVSTDKMLFTAANNEFNLTESIYSLKNVQKFKMSSRVYMNKWSVDHFDMKLATLEKQSVPIRFKSPMLSLQGDTETNIVLTFENKNLDFSGSIFAENLNITSDITELSNKANDSSAQKADQVNPLDEMSLTADLVLKVGTHSSLNFNPLLRCVFVPFSAVSCKIDTTSNLYQLDGSLQLKSGDVAYLNRNFYIREGNIKFNPQDIANPIVTIRAETRERDSDNQTVRIILSAENQYLLDFNPRFTSIPPKSENEIRMLMGQIVLADSSSVGDLFISAGEYYLQSTVVRNLENKLRNLLNFDIFSVRTNILQNTINLSTKRNDTNIFSVGNFFDNSTVYIGKYIGSALYVDAMLNMSASDYIDVEYLSTGNLLFQPELGLELELPVMNIRWDMTWDLTPGLQFKSYVPSTSLSLSWKFNF